TREEFGERYPDEEVPGDALKVGKGVANEVWYEGDAFFIADYYVIETEKKSMCLMDTGDVLDAAEAEACIKEAESAMHALVPDAASLASLSLITPPELESAAAAAPPA